MLLWLEIHVNPQFCIRFTGYDSTLFLFAYENGQCHPPSSKSNALIHIEKALHQIGKELFLWQLLLKAYGIFSHFIFPIVWYFNVSISFIKRNRVPVDYTRFKAEGFITHIMCLMFEKGKNLTADSQTFFFCIHPFHFSCCFIHRPKSTTANWPAALIPGNYKGSFLITDIIRIERASAAVPCNILKTF